MSPIGPALLASLLALAGREPRIDSSADLIVLRDGEQVRGEFVETSPRAGTVTLLVRREWARRHVPHWAKRWEAAEQPLTLRATAERRDRLVAWARERRGGAEDRIMAW